ncbi:cell division protein FtsZ [Filimonas effusa]|uniref:Cell division protein FtsZ n=1 Tax=Filimonas effusa TaxID=2508721 RepID=A0A4V1M9I1_9BACT|nr:cell division protein FtsZ [Filimonas effusa]RXK81228.1 cell division protein FtsZ [Filimonas effusa]
MIHFDLPKQKSSIIKVLGVGGGGSNAVNYMFAQDIEGVDFIICNTDAKALEQSAIPNKIQLGPHLTQGLGAGANPEVGKQATEESLEEIKRILEVNTKMAFICAGMGGGTGTGGAPIIAQICRELGILTVGIVTTPFGFEGPRRQQQAELGIKQLEPYVDTLLVISNDKLRMQYGNLKMKEAFGKADNVLATAAKCITDIINSRGHIIVDFADVCTVMKNGGVAILGSAFVEGEDRAQRAIEEALSSPLLNDNDIRGAKWILININSAEGEHECTMDELEVINTHLRMQAGENTDVIVGMGYDNDLDRKIGITLIATGFEHKDPFERRPAVAQQVAPKEEKIIMTLDIDGAEKKPTAQSQQSLPFEEKDPFAPRLADTTMPPVIVEQKPEEIAPLPQPSADGVYRFELSTDITAEVKPLPQAPAQPEEPTMQYVEKPVSNVFTGFLSKPANIYSEQQRAAQQPPVQQQQPVQQQPVAPQPVQQPYQPVMPQAPAPQQPVQQQPMPHQHTSPQPPAQQPPVQQPFAQQQPAQPDPHAEEGNEFQLVIKEDSAPVQPTAAITTFDIHDDEEDQKRRAAERIQKLRQLSFNMNTSDPNNEFESVPAYIRRNMDLFGNTLTSVENFYSKYTVKTDDNNETKISSLNTFLDGKKPD